MNKSNEIPEWLPDWTNVDEYLTYIKGKDEKDNEKLKKWAWEFLRRNSKYQEHYARVCDYPGVDKPDAYKDSIDFKKYYVMEPKMKKEEKYTDWVNRILKSGKQSICYAKRDKLLDKYGLNHFSKALDPSNDTPPDFAIYGFPIRLTMN